jgi:hypothetical protein
MSLVWLVRTGDSVEAAFNCPEFANAFCAQIRMAKDFADRRDVYVEEWPLNECTEWECQRLCCCAIDNDGTIQHWEVKDLRPSRSHGPKPFRLGVLRLGYSTTSAAMAESYAREIA